MKLYKALGLATSPPPSQAAIKTAFLSLSLETHPDRVKKLAPEEQKAALRRFLRGKEAYEVLKNRDARHHYDLRYSPSSSSSSPTSSRGFNGDFSTWSNPSPKHDYSEQFNKYEQEEEDEEDDAASAKKSRRFSRFSKLFRDAFAPKPAFHPLKPETFTSFDRREAVRATILIWSAVGVGMAGWYFWYSTRNQDPLARKRKEEDAKRAFEERMVMPGMFVKKPVPETDMDSEFTSMEDNRSPESQRLGLNPMLQLDSTIVDYMNKVKERELQNAQVVLGTKK
ncbi:hypothetical protein HDU98_008807 [Podochytrium sp. JEL0797]|nr:hypothetical protein HDU98_008807 [Podochytrium sp. JEL0797]